MRGLIVGLSVIGMMACGSDKTVSARNTPPTALVTFPANGAELLEGDEVIAIGQAADADNASADLTASWRVNGDEVCTGTPDDSGASLCSIVFGAGVAEVQFVVVDPAGAAGSNTITVNVIATDAPTVEITSPDEGSVSRSGDLVALVATVADGEDAASDLIVQWESGLDGPLDVELTVSGEGVVEGYAALDSVGEHSLTVTVTDTDGKSGTDSVLIQVDAPNEAPLCAITAPEDEGVGALSELVTFTADVSDDGVVDALGATWTSDVQGELATSLPTSDGVITYATTALLAGTHTVALTVTDDDGETCTDDIVYTVGAPPVVTISSPLATVRYYEDGLIEFAGTVTDADDTSDELSVVWTSSVDGTLSAVDGTVASDGGFAGFQVLTEGEHALTVTATDSIGLTAEDHVVVDVGAPNTAPTCSIVSPASGTLVPSSSDVIIEGTANDADVPSDLLAANFVSSVDGALGTTTPTTSGDVLFLTTGMSIGSHVVTMTITDDVGATCTDNVLLTIGGAPTVVITAPTDGSTINEGEMVSLAGVISDTEDLPPVLTVLWNSDLDGFIGSGAALLDGTVSLETDSLQTGTHTITLSALDTDGLTGEATITLNINDLPTAPTIAIAPSSPLTADDLVVSVVADGTDDEGETLTYTTAWAKDGVDSGHTTDTVPNADTAKGETWTATVTSHDALGTGGSASASVTVGDAVPVVDSVTIDPDPATTNTVLTAVYSGSDADGDALTYSFAWLVNGVAAGGDVAALDGSTDFSKGDSVTVTVTANDGATDSASVASAARIIDNTPPGAAEVSIDPELPVEARDDLTCGVDVLSHDDDGDTVTYTATWTRDGAPFVGTTTVIDGDTVPATETGAEEAWICTVTPNDGEVDGPVATASVVIERQCDWDDDGFLIDSVACGGDDCDDDDPEISPGEDEVWYDGIDADCDGESDYDADSDGYDHIDYGGEDCADTDPTRIDCSDGVADYLPGAEAPNGIVHHTVEADGSNDRLLMYGGQSYHRLVGTTHAYDLIADEWVELGTFGIDPGERMGHASAMDEATGQMFAFGGQMYHTLSNELLVLDTSLGAETWSLIDTAGGPPPLVGASMVFDPTAEALHIFGGQGYHGLNDELWTYSFGTGAWTGSVVATGPTASGMAAVWDVETDQGMMFGGETYHQLSDVAWCFDGTSFSEATLTGDPLPPFVGAASAMADGYGGAIIYGGQSYHQILSDSYLVRITGTCTAEVDLLDVGVDAPVPSVGSAMAWSTTAGEAFLVGGQTYYALSAAVTGITP